MSEHVFEKKGGRGKMRSVSVIGYHVMAIIRNNISRFSDKLSLWPVVQTSPSHVSNTVRNKFERTMIRRPFQTANLARI